MSITDIFRVANLLFHWNNLKWCYSNGDGSTHQNFPKETLIWRALRELNYTRFSMFLNLINTRRLLQYCHLFPLLSLLPFSALQRKDLTLIQPESYKEVLSQEVEFFQRWGITESFHPRHYKLTEVFGVFPESYICFKCSCTAE